MRSGRRARRTVITFASATRLLPALLTILSSTQIAGQSGSWIKQFGTIAADQVTDIVADGGGNLYATGYTFGGAAFPQDTQGSGTAFLLKLDAAGSVVWIRRFGPPFDPEARNSVFPHGLAVSSSGDVYVTGHTLTALAGAPFTGGFFDAFLLKYDSNGVGLWTRLLGTAGDDIAEGLAIDGAGTIYAAGSTTGSFPGHTNAGLHDAFITTFDPSGNNRWTRQFGGRSPEIASGVAIDASGGVVIAGMTEGALAGQNPDGFSDVFLQKYSDAGVSLWTRQMALPGAQLNAAVAADRSGGIYVSGTAGGLETSGGSDAFVRRFDITGRETWARQFATAGADEFLDIAVHPSGSIHLAGLITPVPENESAIGIAGAFVRRYSSDGSPLASWRFGARVPGCADAITVDQSGNTYIGGLTFGALPGNFNSGANDGCILKLSDSDQTQRSTNRPRAGRSR